MDIAAVSGVDYEPSVYDCVEGPFAEAVQCGGYAQSYFAALGEHLRDRFYFPLNCKPVEVFFENTGSDISTFVDKLRGINTDPDHTFPQLEEIREKFHIEDLPFHIQTNGCIYRFNVRIVESKDQYFDRKIRFVLFSFYDNLEGDKEWDPKGLNEVSGAALEVLRCVQEKFPLHSLMTFSIGNVVMDGLKNLKEEEGHRILPKTFIIDRGLASIEKVSKMLFSYPISKMLYNAAWLTHLDANPEQELCHFFERLSKANPSYLQDRKVLMIEMEYDRYFSGPGGFDPEYHTQLSQTGVNVERGVFYAPAIAKEAHHALGMHLIPAGGAGAKTKNFSPVEQGESVADYMMRSHLLPEKGEERTHFIVGGNRDTLDSIVYLHVAPFMSSFSRLTK